MRGKVAVRDFMRCRSSVHSTMRQARHLSQLCRIPTDLSAELQKSCTNTCHFWGVPRHGGMKRTWALLL